MPATVYLVSGGARSGKSGYGQRLAESLCPDPIYLATATTWDGDFASRVARHQADRGDSWTTVEEPMRPADHSKMFHGRAVLVDCLTLWLTNSMVEEGVFEGGGGETGGDEGGGGGGAAHGVAATSDASERALKRIKAEFDRLVQQWDATFIFVTNELGSGLHPDGHASRKFVDCQGWLNQHVGSRADWVVQMVCGIPNIVKEPPRGDRRDPLAAPSTAELEERRMLDQFLSARGLTMDAKGYFLIKNDPPKGVIRATFFSSMKNEKGEICDMQGNKISCSGDNRPDPAAVFEGRTAKELTVKALEKWEHAREVLSVGHAAYIGREAQRAEACLLAGKHYQQD